MSRIGILLTLAFIFFTSPLAFAEENAVTRRAAFDIGSANIKCTIADVDTISGTIVKTHTELYEKVDFAEDMARSYDGNFSKDIMLKGLEAIKKLKGKALKMGAKHFSAVGGSDFRDARNGRAYFATLKKNTGIPCRILSKEQSTLLSYHAVRRQTNIPEKKLLVWDIGGGTQTMAARTQNGGLAFYIDKMASVPFKNEVITTIQGHDINLINSPNPLSISDIHHCLEYVQTHALLNVNPELASRLRSGTMQVIGIGGVHYFAVPELLGGRNESYTRTEVKAALEEWAGKPDDAFKSEFASTRLTNLILVLGYMNALDIDTIFPLKVNQTEGLLISPEFW